MMAALQVETYYIWAGFEPDSVSYTLRGSIDSSNHSAIETCDTDAATTIVPTSPLTTFTPWPTVVSGVNTSSITVTPTGPDPTPTTVFTLNTPAACEIASVNYDNSGPVTSGLSGSAPYLSGTTYTKALDKTTSFKVLFRKQSVLITATVDAASPAKCTSGSFKFSQSGGYYVKGTNQDFIISLNSGCAIESVIVTDAGSTPVYSNTDVTSKVIANLNKYTFTNIQSAGSITVKFVATIAADKVYCQLPPFMVTSGVLKPNVLILFDNSGSMNDKPLSSTTYNCKSTHTAADLGTSGCSEFSGYFDTKTMYTLSGSTYSKATSTTLNLSSTNKMSGNYLNWSLMSKVDIIRKILIGGKVSTSVTGGVGRGVAGTKYLELYNGGNPKYVEYGTADPTGTVHNVYDTVRMGMMIFSDDSTTGKISAPLGSTKDLLITQMENDTDPGGATPLAGSLYEALHYFRGDTSVKTGVNYGNTTLFPVDPLYSRHAIQASCQKNFMIVITDGEPNESTKLPGVSTTPTVGSAGNALFDLFKSWWNSSTLTIKPPANGTTNHDMARVAYYAHTNDLLSGTTSTDLDTLHNNLNIFTVYTFDSGNTGEPALQQAAKFGSFDEDSKNASVNNTNHNGMPDVNGEWSTSSGTVYNNYFKSMNPTELEKSIEKVFSNIGAMSASGTAAAVANNKSGDRGANLIQALFYQQWPNDAGIKWLGEVQALWYYLDPVIGYSAIYEDSNNDNKLDLNVDQLPNADPFAAKALWRAGAELHKRTTARNIYTLLDSTNLDLTSSVNAFTASHVSTLRTRMNLGVATDVGAIPDTQAGYLIDYIRGTDRPEYRSRMVDFKDPRTAVETKGSVWKLGDVINSTPQVQSSVPLNAYHNAYGDLTYDKFIKSAAYKSRNVVYAGSNDGLFHAFRLGTVTSTNTSIQSGPIATMSGSDRGSEEWAFIPGNALPYITNQAGVDYCHQCLVDGAPTVVDASINNWCSATNYWTCERKDTSWKSVVVSSMGLGGASRDKDSNCNETYSPDLVATNNKDCVKSPISGGGMSSYFALDVSDPLAPKLMWEFSDSNIDPANKAYKNDGTTSVAAKGLGFTTTGAYIIRINDVAGGTVQRKNNGHWFAVIASGPTGEITGNLTFTGHSDQNLKIYIVDLNSGPTFTQCTSTGQPSGCNYWVKDTGIPFAFANSLNSAAIDLDRGNAAKAGNYSDDVVYVAYTKAALTPHASNPAGDFPSSSTAWNKGGVIRLVTNHNPDPFTWFTSSLIDDIGPITTSIGKAQDGSNKKLWIYFGEGRSFFPGDETNVQRRIFGVSDPCYTQYGDAIPSGSATADNSDSNFTMGKTPASCPAVAFGDLQNQDTPDATAAAASTARQKGWYIDMAATAGTAGAERVVSDVTVGYNGAVFYTTYTPNTDPCTPGGTTSLWAVDYRSGGAPSSLSMVGKAPVQTSTGGVKLIDLASAFTQNYNRKLNALLSPKGMAPKGKFPALLSPKAAKRIISIQQQ